MNRINPVSKLGQWATDKIQYTIAHNPKLTPLYIGTESSVSGLLEDKTQLPEEFLDAIGLQTEIQDRLREIQYHEPESITHCNTFLEDMTRKAMRREFVE